MILRKVEVLQTIRVWKYKWEKSRDSRLFKGEKSFEVFAWKKIKLITLGDFSM